MKKQIKVRKDASRIATEGTKAAKKKAAASREAIEQAIKAIEADVEKNKGIYPLANGRISRKEVLRRAGKSPSYLNKSDEHIVELRRDVDAFVDRACKLAIQGAKSIRKTVTERVEASRDEADIIRQAWHEAELEHVETLAELEKARREVKELQATNTSLLKELSDKTVVDMPTRRK